MTAQDYYNQVEPTAKPTLLALRELIRPLLGGQPEEIISYQIPTFVYQDCKTVAIAAFKDHVSLFPLGSRQINKFQSELADYKTSAATIQFELNQKLPADLIRR